MGLFSKMAKSAAFTVLAAAVVNSFAVTVNNQIGRAHV